MTAPLSLYLTRFSAPLPSTAIAVEAPPPEPLIVMTAQELDARLEAATDVVRRESDQHHSMEIAQLSSTHERTLADALTAARDEWAATAGAGFAGQIEAQFLELRTTLSNTIASVLRPLLVDTVRTRTIEALMNTIDQLLADPIKPPILVRGPEDLLAIMSEARPVSGINWDVADEVEIRITAGATQIETRLAETLAEIEMTENPHVR